MPEGRWITIGGHPDPKTGKKHVGGSPVYIQDGRIVAGHPSLVGRSIAALKEAPAQGTHRQQLHQSRGYARASWGKKARKQGVHAKHLHQLAAEMLAHDRAFTDDHNRILRDARALSKHYGRDIGNLATLAGRGNIDPSKLKHFDEVATSTARDHPELLGLDESQWSQRLFDLLSAGNRKPMEEDAAYEKALEHLLENQHEQEAQHSYGSADEPVPFSLAEGRR